MGSLNTQRGFDFSKQSTTRKPSISPQKPSSNTDTVEKVKIAPQTSNPNEYVNLTKNVLQKSVIQRGKEVVIEFPIVVDDEENDYPKYDPETINTWVYPTNYVKRYFIYL